LKLDESQRKRVESLFNTKFIYPWVLKCSRSFLPIIHKIFISGSFRISWLVVRFPFFRFFD
jgi:hypothetical protein